MNKNHHLPTIKDVARLAGVSYQTVSNVVNGEVRISEGTRAKVLAAIEELGYQPHAAARTLRSGKSKIIGLMIPDLMNPHFQDTVRGAEDEALANGYSLLLTTAAMNRQREQVAFTTLLQQRLDGIIPLFTYIEDFLPVLAQLKERRMPVALSFSGASVVPTDADIVWVHFEEAADEMMAYLLKLGHRRIAMIQGVGRSGLANDRVHAYRQGLSEAGISFDAKLLVQCGHSLEDGFRAAEYLLELSPRPTAIIGINDLMAFGAMQAILQSGLRIPEDVSVLGFDDLPLSSLVWPRLTTGRADGADVGRQCVKLILARLADPELPQQQVHLHTHLVVRESTGPVRQ